MDKEWERIQQRVFTNWVNSHLRKRSLKCENLITDLETGVLLIHLYEIISDESLGKFYPAPVSKFHKIANLSSVVDKINSFVSSVGIKVQFSAEQIFAGDVRSILGMIWVLIHKFEIQDISEEELSARDGLLLWCKKKTAGYNNVKVQNFSDSWQDGLAFCALIHVHRPDLIDFDSLKKENALENLQLAFNIAEKELDIPQLLDAADMVNFRPDDKSVMTYVAYYWKRFASSRKAEQSAKKIAKISKRERELRDMEHDYERRAGAWKQWSETAITEHQDTSFDHFGNSLAKVVERNTAFKQFKDVQKPPQSAERVDLEILLTNIRSKQKTEGLPIYNPPQEISTPVLHELWDNLNDTQDVYDKALREHLALMKRLELLLNRFRSRGKKIQDWQTNKTNTYLAEDISKLDTISALQAKIKVHETFDDNVASVDNSLAGAKTIGDEIVQHNHESAEEVQQTVATLEENQQQVRTKAQEKGQQLQEQLKRLEEVIANCLEFARLSEHINLFFDDVDLAMSEPISANTVKDVDNQIEYVDKVDKDLTVQQETVNKLADLTQKIQDAGYSAQIYTDNTYENIAERFNNSATEIDKRKQDLATERERQQGNAVLLSDFAKNAAEYKKWTAEKQKQFNEVGTGSPEEQLKNFRDASESVVTDNDSKHADLDKQIGGLEAAEVLEQSDVTQQELGLLHANLQRTITKNIENMEQAILAQKSSNLSAEQIKDFQEAFKYFDKDKDGKLNKLDFKATCNSLGEDIPEQELDRVFANYDTDKDGSIEFEEFLDYMSKIAKEGGGYEDVLEAFKQLANGNQYITEAQLRQSVEKQEVDYLLTKMPKVGEEYDYEAYLKNVYSKE